MLGFFGMCSAVSSEKSISEEGTSGGSLVFGAASHVFSRTRKGGGEELR